MFPVRGYGLFHTLVEMYLFLKSDGICLLPFSLSLHCLPLFLPLTLPPFSPSHLRALHGIRAGGRLILGVYGVQSKRVESSRLVAEDQEGRERQGKDGKVLGFQRTQPGQAARARSPLQVTTERKASMLVQSEEWRGLEKGDGRAL